MNDPELGRSPNGHLDRLTAEIFRMLKSFHGVDFDHIRTSGNKAVDRLANVFTKADWEPENLLSIWSKVSSLKNLNEI